MGIPVLRDGNILELASQKLSVVEACSGIRSLLSLSFLSLVYAYFFDKRVWMRWVLLAATIPIAILANSGRVTITGVLSEINPELARGFFHSLEGFDHFLDCPGHAGRSPLPHQSFYPASYRAPPAEAGNV